VAKLDKISAPFTLEQVESLNKFQYNRRYHPFTCGNDRSDKAHKGYATAHDFPDNGLLVATQEGWVCPVCRYTQSWAWEFMTDGTHEEGDAGYNLLIFSGMKIPDLEETNE
jgi:hypothetical protein